jgi:hypothetical protein
MKTTDELISLERKAQELGHAVAEINGHKICCRIKYQRRNGLRVPSAYFTMDDKRTKYADVLQAIAA